MIKDHRFDLTNFYLSNDLWPNFTERIGFSKALIAIRQAQDLQTMQGTQLTLPVLIVETCGCALVSIDLIRRYTGISPSQDNMILIYSSKLKQYQLLKEL